MFIAADVPRSTHSVEILQNPWITFVFDGSRIDWHSRLYPFNIWNVGITFQGSKSEKLDKYLRTTNRHWRCHNLSDVEMRLSWFYLSSPSYLQSLGRATEVSFRIFVELAQVKMTWATEDILVASALILTNSVASFGWLRCLNIFLPLCVFCTSGIVFAWVLFVAYATRELVLWGDDDLVKDRFVLGRPLLFPSQLTHARLFPDQYCYGIDYFLVGIPVGLRGRVGGLMSIDSDGRRSNSPISKSLLEKAIRKFIWFSFDTSQYLHRGDGHMTLTQKLERFLEEQVCISPTVKNLACTENSRERT